MKFKTVLLDPPWMERGGGKSKRGADRHYPLLSTPKMPSVIQSCPFWSNLEDSCHMYMWVTNNFLPDGLWLIEKLGFRYITNVVWVKDKFGLGQYFRGQHELCLFATRGRGFDVKTDSHSIPSVLNGKRDKHSKKPESFYDLIEKRSNGSYLEIFARSKRDNWVSWGNEIEEFNFQNEPEPPEQGKLFLQPQPQVWSFL
jgi:N6-adenosine-specific RNA methylase IME4